MNLKKTLLTVAFCALFVLQSLAAPAYPHPITVTQPDGQTLTIQLHGDEFFSYVTTTDGYLLKQNNAGAYEYAYLSTNNTIEAIGIVAHNNRTSTEITALESIKQNQMIPAVAKQLRTQGAANNGMNRLSPNPLRGNAKGLVILVNFSDLQFTIQNPQQAFSDMLNQPGYSRNGGTGCASEYYAASSDSLFTPVFDVFGPYTVSQPMAYYGAHKGQSNDSEVRQMIQEACNLADADVDFSEYDTDNDGKVDNVFVYYAGHNEAEGGSANSIWPHRSTLMSPTLLQLDGKYVYDYACTSELKHSSGTTMCGIGTFCHEFSHVLGLPDLYDTDYSSSPNLSTWDIMCSGNYNNGGCTPPVYSAYERFFLNYLTPELLSDPRPASLEPLETSNKAYLISPTNQHNLSGTSPNPQQFFILENRQELGWDRIGLPGTGLLITRVDYNSAAWNSNSVNDVDDHHRVTIIEAYPNGFADGGDTYPGTHNIKQFQPTLWDGTLTDGAVTNITNEGGIITFLYRGGGDDFANATLSIDKVFFETEQGTPTNGVAAQVSGRKLYEDLTISFSDTRHFEIRLENDSIWKKSVSLTPETDSTVEATVYVRYNPTKASNTDFHTTYLQLQGCNLLKRIELKGRSSQKMNIYPPIATEATRISPYGFQVNWEPEAKAVGYYITVFKNDDGKTTESEGFNTFATLPTAGWTANFTTTTSKNVPSSPCAVLFTSEFDGLYSCYYPQPVTELSFWLRSEDVKQNAFFYVEALNENGWDTIANLEISKSYTSAQTKTIPLSAADNYRRFRFTVDSVTSNGIAFDDVKVTYDGTTVKQRAIVYDVDSALFDDMEPATNYVYVIQATDQDPMGKFENVTDYSNRIEVTTYGETEAAANDKKHRYITVRYEDGTPILSIKPQDLLDKDGNPLDIYVFTVNGQLLKRIPSSEFIHNPSYIRIEGLPENSVSIVSLGVGHKNKFVKIVQ
ncbi:MAG: M6 family metalloprotease domain-containing protein [Paludibacteraceae bacterium]|nr:M6 family metalloprotease domain-containing protein [Paludibacteraceae bacterium]